MEAFYKRLLGTMEGGVVEALFRAQVQLTEALDTNTTALSSRERLVPALPLLLSPLLGQVSPFRPPQSPSLRCPARFTTASSITPSL